MSQSWCSAQVLRDADQNSTNSKSGPLLHGCPEMCQLRHGDRQWRRLSVQMILYLENTHQCCHVDPLWPSPLTFNLWPSPLTFIPKRTFYVDFNFNFWMHELIKNHLSFLQEIQDLFVSLFFTVTFLHTQFHTPGDLIWELKDNYNVLLKSVSFYCLWLGEKEKIYIIETHTKFIVQLFTFLTLRKNKVKELKKNSVVKKEKNFVMVNRRQCRWRSRVLLCTSSLPPHIHSSLWQRYHHQCSHTRGRSLTDTLTDPDRRIFSQTLKGKKPRTYKSQCFVQINWVSGT